ncbi:toll/interleukin-1 receptor domain-containing protein [Geomonas ferrireducens]|uniref:toll/interleukin-1 receptor domain-containing protein n=1 Tax=Geomonas ferrireducens TaxID=2570227 RepID=UPI0010A93A60|nr:toll/interleukin-1 receptor domain-containing protein [Geomonas ferrireducens]
MPLFISYSHTDKDFVDNLAMQLVARNVHVWLDRWEMHVGESIIDKVQQAITDASALLVVLSPDAVASEWCRKELNSGLIRELEERRIVILPVLFRDCDIPIFLREKMYADFRTNFDEGLRTIHEAVAKVTNEWRNRLEKPNWHTDWGIDWGYVGGRLVINLTMIEVPESQPYSVLTLISLLPAPDSQRWYKRMVKEGKGDVARNLIIAAFSEALSLIDHKILLEDQFPQHASIPFSTAYGDFLGNITTRLLGTDTGRDVLFYTAQQIAGINEQMKKVVMPPKGK